MLGCHDFCGYYDWTFAHVVKNFGNDALRDLWSEAIGADAPDTPAPMAAIM